MRLFLRLFLPAILATGQLFAQLDNYTIARTTSCACYTDISGTGTAVTSWRNGTSTDNNLSNSLNIGFSFPYDGAMYTQFRVSVDGFITFNTVTNTDGDDLPGYGVCSNVVEAYTYDNTKFTAVGLRGTLGALAPFYNDLFCRNNSLNTSMHYQLTGSSPNRVLTVQWRGMANDYSGDSDCSDDGGSLNFQVKIYETSGDIEFLYSTMTQTTVSCTGSGTYTINNSYTSGINSSTLTASPTLAMLLTQQTANTATFSNTAQNGLTTLPSANSRITFTRTAPAAPVAVPPCAVSNYPANGATNQCLNATFSWANTGGVPTGYDVYFGTSSTPPLVSSNQGTNYYSPGALATNTTYYWKIVPKNSFGDAAGCTTWSFTTVNGDVSPTSIASSAGNPICVGTTTTLSIVGGSLSEGSVFNWTSPFVFNLGCKNNLTYPLFSGNCMASSYTNTYNTAGTYQYDVFVRGCNGTTSCTHINLVVNATNNTAPTGVTASPSGTVCGGTSITLTATGGTLGTGASTQWYTGSCGGTLVGTSTTNSITVNPSSTTTYYVRRTGGTGNCPNTTTCASITITVQTAIGASNTISADQTICSGQTPAALSGSSPTGGNGTYTYLWESSTDGTTYAAAAGTNNTQNYSPGALTQTTWYRRNVSSGTCTGTSSSTSAAIIITISPAPSAVGTITGSTSPCPGAQTYSISSVTNATSYLWSVSAGGSISSGQGSTSISVNWTTAGGPYTVSVTASNGCGSTSNTKSVTVSGTPAAVGGITGNTNPCPGAEAYSISSVTNATSYVWSVSAGGSIASGQGTTAISVNWTAAGGPYTVSVTASNGCGSTSNSTPVTVQSGSLGAVGAISGNTNPCPGAQTYSISSVTNATSYVWSVSAGGTIASGQGTTSISVNWTTSGGPYTVSVTASNSCGSNSNSATVSVQNAAPAAVGAITGSTNPCPGAQTYSIGSVTNATSYLWSVSAGGTIASGQGTTSISVNWTTSGGPYTVSVTASSACGSTSNSVAVTVQTGPPAAVGAITGNTNPCPGAQTYSISSVANATSYVWNVSAGGTIASGQGTTSISVNWTTSGGPYTVSVTASNSCGSTSNSATVAVQNAAPGAVGAITGNTNPCPVAQTYSIGSVTNATSYLWSVSGGGTIASGQGTTSISVNWTTSGGPYTVSVTASSACGSTSNSVAVTVQNGTPAAVGAITGNTNPCPVAQTYSIGSVTNATSYLWSVSGGGTIASGQGTTSISVNWTTSGGPYTVSVTASNACGSTSNSVAVTVQNGTPGAVGAITGNTNPCPVAQTYSIGSVTNATSYVWSVSAGGTIASGQGTTSISVNWTTSGGPYTVSVTAGNACGSTSNSVAVTVQNGTPAAVGAITGNANPCPVTQTYSIGSVTNATSYVWSVSGGGTISSGQGTTSISVDWTTSGGPYTVSVTASNTCGSTSNSVAVTVQNGTPGAVGTISGNTNPCPVAQTYSIGSVTNATSYVWSVSGGGTISLGQGTTSISVNWTTSGGPYTVSVTASNACGSTSNSLAVTVQNGTPGAVGAISGNTNPCPGAQTYSIGSVTNATSYSWSVSGGGTISSGQGTTSVSVNWTTGGGPYTVSVTASNSCGSTSNSLAVNVNSPSTSASAVTGTGLICNGQSTTLSVSGGSLGTGANWHWYSASCAGTPEGTGTSISPAPTATTTYYVRAEGTCGNTACFSYTVTVNQPSVAPTGITGTSTICNGASTTLTVTGGSLGTSANWQWYVGSCGGTSVGSGPSITVSPTSNTTYFVRAEGPAPCATATACASQLITVNTLSTDPVSVSGTTTICEGTSTTLSVVGGSLGTGGAWKWYSGACGSGAAIGTGSSITVTPTTSTGYYVRAEGTCNTTNCAFAQVTVNDSSVAATSITGSPAICTGSSTTLSVVGGHLGVNANWHWYRSICGGTQEGTGSAITVSPANTTTYYVRAAGLCNTTNCVPFTVTVNPLPNGYISGSVTVCSGTDTALTFNFTTGTGPFNVLYSDGSNLFTRNNVSTGDTIRVSPGSTTTWSLQQITDAHGCVRTTGFLGAATVTVAPLPVVSNVFVQDVLCNGGNTGSINVTASNGTPGYDYSNNNGATYQSNNLFTGLTAGTYQLFIKDDLGCKSNPAYPVVVNEPPVLTHTTTPQNASCDNVFDGKITVNATGGVQPYTYSLNGGSTQPGNVFSGLAAATYTVLVTDFNSCTSSSSATLDTAYAVYASLVSQTPVSCFGGADGSVSVQLTGGIPPYTYSINGLQFVSNSTFTGLAAGNYVVTLRDSKGCTDFVNVTITQPLQLQAQIDSVHNIECNGGNSGAIYISVSGGTPAYSFLWSNNAATEDVTGLTAGTYNVTISDSKGCSASTGATISQPFPLYLNVASYHDLLCFNDSSGAIDITANGGVPPYSFRWSIGDTTEDIYGLLPGTYSATVTDANGCQQSISQAIIQPSQLSSTISSTPVLCAGAASGSVDLSVTGGTSPYNYVWNNGATSQDLSGVSGGTYTVVVHDANGCTLVNSALVTEPAPVTISLVKTDVLCHGALTGAIDITVNGGTPAITYAWSNAATTEDITGIGAGNYSVMITDGNSCTASAGTTISQPAAIVMNSSVVNVGCAGGAGGSVDITVQGGVFPYSYIWNNGATTEDIHNVSGGSYAVTVTDANICTVTAAFNITEPGAISSSIVGTDVTCNGANDGAADLTVGGGTAPYSFLWSTFEGSEDVSGLDGGLYYVIITDANGCEGKDSILIDEASPIVLSTVVTNISCAGANDGMIDLTATGGTPAYSYAWSNLATSQDISSLPGGLYVVTVTDTHSCTATTSATIVNPSAIHANFVVKNPLCFGDTSGRIDLIPSGGTPAYAFLWSNGVSVEDLTNVGEGTYIVTITDSRNCNHVDSATVSEPGQIFTSGVVKNVTCSDLSDGFVDITAYAGTLPYSYLWSTGQSTEDIFNIAGGDYYVTVTDDNGCQAVSLYIIKEPMPLGISLVKTDVECYGAATGKLAAIPAGGSVPYFYLWNNFITDSAITGAIAGHYVVQLTDSNGCFIYDSIDVSQPTEITIAGSVVNAVCNGSSTGGITVNVTGGTPAYTYSWTGGSTNQNLTGVTAGSYALTVTDSKTCQKSASYIVTQPLPMLIHFVPEQPGCYGSTNGALTVDVHQGTEPYSYSWNTSPPQNSESISGLSAGDYTVTVTDATGCSASSTKTLNQPTEVVLTLNNLGSKCFNTATGMVIVGVTGGVSPFIYTVNGHAQSTDTITGLDPGNYFLVVEDINGCKGTASFETSAPGPISVDLNVTEQVILTGMQTQLIATASSDTTILHYFWSPDSLPEKVFDYSGCGDPQNCTNPLVAPRTTTTFTVTVMNADSCYASDTVTVQVLNQQSNFIPTAFTPNADDLNDRFEFDMLGATNINVAIFDRWGQRVYYNPSQTNGITNHDGWDGKVNGKPAPFDTYVYQMKVTFFDTVTKDFAGTVTLMK